MSDMSFEILDYLDHPWFARFIAIVIVFSIYIVYAFTCNIYTFYKLIFLKSSLQKHIVGSCVSFSNTNVVLKLNFKLTALCTSDSKGQ